MKKHNLYGLLAAVVILLGSCTSTRYLTDEKSIERQHDMRTHRTGGNIGDVCVNFATFAFAAIFNTGYEVYSSERTFKKITIVNESTDSLYINMVTDIVWKETGYCDIVGIALPPLAKQKLIAPYPAAYNVYFRTPGSEEEMLEIRTDNTHKRFKLHAGMTNWIKQNENDSIREENSIQQ
ncbi:MAG: hypothetical protein WC384_09660 [Prolixibacteraceae bacterium]|jgi:hypothetical protein